MIGDILLFEGAQSSSDCLPVALNSFAGEVLWRAARPGMKLRGGEEE
jgi:hypothetical protein